ncbi:MAG: hypothetical protein HQ513_01520 [Rhodospirillales bacterium]|nr:hypothetical protein [Rhodospirillales bacterium]
MAGETPEQILSNLRDGRPIIGSSEDPNPCGVLRDDISRGCIEAIKEGVNRASTNQGHVSVYRLYGTPGIGKSQTLYRAYNEIRNTAYSDKTAVAFVNVESAGGDSGLQREIVLSTVTAGETGSELDKFAAKLANKGDAGAADYVGFGVDVLFGIAGSPIGPGLLVSKGYGAVANWFKLSERNLRSKINKRFPDNKQITEFLTSWLAYIMQPTNEKKTTFIGDMNSYTKNGNLFDIFCLALETAGYKSLVIVLDEVVENDMAILKMLWENPDGIAREHRHGLGRVMVCASVNNIWADIDPNSAHGRRFMNTPNGDHQLSGPRVEAAVNSNDDYAHASTKLLELGGITGVSKSWKDDSAIDEAKIRGELNTQTHLTWNQLWDRLLYVREN